MSVGPSNKKQYGLIIPKAKATAPVKKRPLSSVFNVDSDEDVDEKTLPAHLQKNSFKGIKRQARIDIQRALEDDPTVYQYDEVYDDMKQTKQNQISEKKKDKTSKYAKNLIRNAALRKLENDRHFERKCQRELEEEGDEFADKETFVTSSYKKKLAELAELEDEIKRKADEEKRNDVTKKADLTDFYRNILAKRTEAVTSDEATFLSKVEPARKQEEPEKNPVNIRKILAARRQYRAKKREEESIVTDDEGGSEEEKDSVKQKTVKKEPDSEITTNTGEIQIKSSQPADEDEDRDDSNSSDSSDESDTEAKKISAVKGKEEEEEKKDEVSKSQPKTIIQMSDEERNELRIRTIRQKFQIRNTPETIAEAKERYWARKASQVA